MDAFYWLGAAFEIVSQKVYADEEREFEDFHCDCVEDWNILFDDATDGQREQMHAWFWERRAAFFAHAQGVTDIDFLYLAWGVHSKEKALKLAMS